MCPQRLHAFQALEEEREPRSCLNLPCIFMIFFLLWRAKLATLLEIFSKMSLINLFIIHIAFLDLFLAVKGVTNPYICIKYDSKIIARNIAIRVHFLENFKRKDLRDLVALSIFVRTFFIFNFFVDLLLSLGNLLSSTDFLAMAFFSMMGFFSIILSIDKHYKREYVIRINIYETFYYE